MTRKRTLLNYRKIWIKFWNPEFESAIEGTIWKTDSNAEKCVFFWEIWVRIWKKTVYKHSVLTSAHTLSAEKKNTFSWEQFCKSFFAFQSNDKEGKQYYTIHLEDWILRGKNPFQIQHFDCKIQHPGYQSFFLHAAGIFSVSRRPTHLRLC